MKKIILTVQQVMLPQSLDNLRFQGSLRTTSDISYIVFFTQD